MSLKTNSIPDEQVARNIVRALVQKGDWAKVEQIARGLGGGLAASVWAAQEALTALDLRDEKAARRAAPRLRKRRPGPVVLSGPAAAGKRGGGKEAPPLPPTPSRKTNVGFWSKGTSVAKTVPIHDGNDKKNKKRKDKK